MAPRVAPLQWTPSQYTTNSVSAGYAAIFDSMILRYGILIAPGTWPAVYLSGPRTSTTTMPGSRSEEHTSELQSLMRISYAVFCLKKKKKTNNTYHNVQLMYTTSARCIRILL